MSSGFVTHLDKLERELFDLCSQHEGVMHDKKIARKNPKSAKPSACKNGKKKSGKKKNKPHTPKETQRKGKSKAITKHSPYNEEVSEKEIINQPTDLNANVCPILLTPETMLSVEKVNSCPGRTCCCAKRSKLPARSYNSLQICHSDPRQPVTNHSPHVTCVPGVLNQELKQHLQDISQCKIEAVNMTHALKNNYKDLMENKTELFEEIAQLQKENKALKNQLNSSKINVSHYSVESRKHKDILDAYEEKIKILHHQTLKSAKLMTRSKQKFCEYLRDKEEIIKKLTESNECLMKTIIEKSDEADKWQTYCKRLEVTMSENEKKYSKLSMTNDNLCKCVKQWEGQLMKSIEESERCREYIKTLELQICETREVLLTQESDETLKLKQKYETQIQIYEKNEQILTLQISDLSGKIAGIKNRMGDADHINYKQLQSEHDECQANYIKIKEKLSEYEQYAERSKTIELECKKKCEIALKNEKVLRDKYSEMNDLVEELTGVVKQNKITLMEMSEINKKQEELIETQSAQLLNKDQKLQIAVSEIEMFQKKSTELENVINGLKTNQNCDCDRLVQEVEELRSTLNKEQDNHLIKQKIIADQSQTILTLQCQVKETTTELSKIRQLSEIEITKINTQLEQELTEKRGLLQKLQKLEHQKFDLMAEMQNLEDMLENYKDTSEGDERKCRALEELQRHIEDQKEQWERQLRALDSQKAKAETAAKFATDKLIQTVNDFQRQVHAQKKVQFLLTNMLRDKDLQLHAVKSKMLTISALTHAAPEDFKETSVHELFKTSQFSSNTNQTQNTTPSLSSLSKSSPCALRLPKSELQEILEMLNDELAIKN